MFLTQISRFLLFLFRPFFRLAADKKTIYFKHLREEFIDPYLCGMVTRFGFFHELIFSPFFKRVRSDPHELSRLKNFLADGTLVYIMKNRGQLEYSFFNHLFLKEGIPLARFANGCRTLFWKPFTEIFRSLLARLDYFYEKGDLSDPIGSGYLENLVYAGESALLNLKISHDFIFGTTEDPLEFIPPLIRAASRSEKKVWLVTQQFLYDRHPEKTDKSLVDILFGEKSNPGMFRKLILFGSSFRKRATVKFGDLFDLKRFISENPGDDPVALASKLKQILLTRLMVEKKSITGPVLQPADRLFGKMLSHPLFRADLEAYMKESGGRASVVEKRVKKYFGEIAASVNYNYIDFYNHVCHWMFNNIYDGLDIDFEGLSRIKAVAGKYPIVLVPSHKSHIDYILLSYIFYNYDLTMPHVCAGINLNFWPVSRFIRRGGGFFVRRTFSGKRLYRIVFMHYLKLLVREGYTIEFFIEGTRSRTGKLLKPKMGVLSMLMQSFLEGAAPDVYFVPLSVNYERIFEEKSYVKELRGSAKKAENMRDILKASRKLHKKYGKVFVRFANPISLKNFFDEAGISPSGKKPEEIRPKVEEFANLLTYNINRAAVVTSTSLAAISLLSHPGRGISQSSVLERISWLKDYLEFKGASLTDIIRQKGERSFVEALGKLVIEKTIAIHRDFREIFYTIDESRRVFLDYHKNNSLHFLVSLACFSKILKTAGGAEIGMDSLVKKYRLIKRLLSSEFTFSDRESLEYHLSRVVGFCAQEHLLAHDPKTGLISFAPLKSSPRAGFYASLLDNYFESLYLAVTYLYHVPFDRMERGKLSTQILEKGQALCLKGDLKYPEAVSKVNIGNALKTLTDLGLLRLEENYYAKGIAGGEALVEWKNLLETLIGPAGAVYFNKSEPSSDSASAWH